MTDSQAFWENDDNLESACKWIKENFGGTREAFILFAGQSRRDYASFLAAVHRGHERANKVLDKLSQAEDSWMLQIKQEILDSGDTRAISRMYRQFIKESKEQEQHTEFLEKMERRKKRLHAKGILTDHTTWGELLNGEVK